MKTTVTSDLSETSPLLLAKARLYVRASRAESTLKVYKRTFHAFKAWCGDHGRVALPASDETICLFLSDIAERYRPKSLQGFVSGIAFAHRAHGYRFDRKVVEVVLSGIRRTHGMRSRQVAAICVDELRTIVATLPSNLRGARDRALLVVGFAGALRCTELVGLDFGCKHHGGTGFLQIGPEGARIELYASKSDQEGKGISKFLPRGGNPCPVQTLEWWLAVSGISSGPVFRPITRWDTIGSRRLRPQSVGEIVKRCVAFAQVAQGMTLEQASACAAQVSSHSLRAGFVTSAVAANVTSENIARHVGWKSTIMTLRYVREHQLKASNPLRQILGP
jgi:integrase